MGTVSQGHLSGGLWKCIRSCCNMGGQKTSGCVQETSCSKARSLLGLPVRCLHEEGPCIGVNSQAAASIYLSAPDVAHCEFGFTHRSFNHVFAEPDRACAKSGSGSSDCPKPANWLTLGRWTYIPGLHELCQVRIPQTSRTWTPYRWWHLQAQSSSWGLKPPETAMDKSI